VTLIDLGWLFSNQMSFLDLSLVLHRLKRSELFMTDLVKTLVDTFWIEYKWKIFWRIFMPYVVYLCLTLYYMINVVCVDELQETGWESYIGFLNLISAGLMLYIEYYQLFNSDDPKKVRRYFSDVMNILDLFQYSMTSLIVLMTMLGLPLYGIGATRVTCSILVFLIWLKIFDWLRLFDSTSFYIKLILVTITDILPFFLIFPVFLLTYGTALYILSTNREADAQIVDEYMGWWLIDATLNQYLLSLGEFSMDNFNSGPQRAFCYFLFVTATFFTQITALNMLIAIMGNTFETVTNQYSQHQMQMKISLLADYVNFIRTNKAVCHD